MVSEYTDDEIRALLKEAFKSHDYAYGVTQETYREPGMPRGFYNPAHGNTIYAALSDVERAVSNSGLTRFETTVVWWCGVWDARQADVADWLECSQGTISKAYDSAVTRMREWLNG